MSIERISPNTTTTFNLDNVRNQQTTIDTKMNEQSKGISYPEKEEQKVSKNDMQKIVNSMNDFLQPTHTSLKFELHEKLQEYYVTIVDDKTQEVVREIPSKKLLDVYAAMTEFVGLMVDKKI